MKNFKMIVQYEGTRYGGWQRQESTDQTIQGKLEAIFSKMQGEPVTINGSGRTDAGVHARGQVINVKLNTEKSNEELQTYVNEYLPEDIYIARVEQVNDRFHARLSAKKKQYTYRIVNGSNPNVFKRRFTYHLMEQLNCEKMRQGARCLIGTHDYASFTSKKKSKKSTIRTIESIVIDEIEDEVRISFIGDGFLYHMVRILVGTLIEIGLEQRDVIEIPVILEAKERKEAGYLVPAKGLQLDWVSYE